MDKEYIETLIKKDIKTLGYDIWGIELLGSSLNPTLRIFIDNENGVTVEDCEKVSKHICKVLETENNFERNFVLEVSSPGIKRKFFQIFCSKIGYKKKRKVILVFKVYFKFPKKHSALGGRGKVLDSEIGEKM